MTLGVIILEEYMGTKRTLQQLAKTTRPLVFPGCYDALSARIAEMAGFEAVLVGGFSTSASLFALPDFGILTQTEMIRTVRYVAQAVDIPVIADADTGYGGPINVIRTVKELENAGAKGMILEDQLWPKRCGHMTGKKVIPAEEYEQKLLAALETRRDPGFFIVARTDALGPLGIEEAMRRANRYRELGADAIFVEAPKSKDDLRVVRQNVSGPLIANMIEGGLTPILTLEDFEELGYQFVGYVLSSIFTVAKALTGVLTELKAKGTTKQYEQHMTTFKEFTEIVRLPEFFALEQKYSLKQ
jgi:2-methylisocitrate lyase-like PEP mutase family enzyme